MAIRSRLVKLGRNANDQSAMGDGGTRIKPQATQQVMVRRLCVSAWLPLSAHRSWLTSSPIALTQTSLFRRRLQGQTVEVTR